ncbi:MAG: ribonuclease PH [Candidatus Aureabacteria bacterium]|jgi:ribonuclease PH|nr:ribonuclease PH [Candidatus Auribacterota bacterium]NLW93976.1 ribonuclease PH [Chlamydiota bacterium]HOE27443.1 ribonuclease PH [bacterium]HQM52714.1 ribonuclease PH [bacterium]
MSVNRKDGRKNDELRQVRITPDFVKYPLGSVLVEFGDTKILCAASADNVQPRWMRDQKRPGGWISCEYSMMPFSSPERMVRESTRGRIGGRTHEIQRMIGRALRAVVDLESIGPRTIWIDCEVLQADGGTRTASVTGSFVALRLALRRMAAEGLLERNPLREALAAVSVGKVDGEILLDLDYEEDCRAQVDMNLVVTESGRFIEIQGTAETEPFTAEEMASLTAMARSGIAALIETQKRALEGRS